MDRRLARRNFIVAAVYAAAFLPSLATAAAVAVPFVSDRVTARTEGAGPDVVLVPGLDSGPRTWATTVAALPGYRYHMVQVKRISDSAHFIMWDQPQRFQKEVAAFLGMP
jgi:pimeloyl-ACP methyl ester carboxylesterase